MKRTLASICLALASCARPTHITQDLHTTTQSVPVVAYRVQSGDTLNSLFREELGAGHFGKPPGAFYKPTAVDSDYTPIIAMRAEKVMLASKYATTVSYRFEGMHVMNLLNPSHMPFDVGTQLRAGESLYIPDFSKDGRVHGQRTLRAGMLTFKGVCDDEGKLVKKELSYNERVTQE